MSVHFRTLCQVALAPAMLTLLVSCSTSQPAVPTAATPATAAPPAPVVTPTSPTPPPAPAGHTVVISDASAATAPLRVAIVSAGDTSADTAGITLPVSRALQQQLLSRSIETPSATPDLIAALSCASREADRAGKLVVYAGEAELDLVRAFDQRRIAATNVAVRGGRSVEPRRAQETLATSLTAALLPALDAGLASPTAQRTVRTVTVGFNGAPADAPAYAQRFVTIVGALPGVTACRLSRQSANGRELVFTVAYFSGAFPEGLLNTLLNLPVLSLTVHPTP